MSFDCEFCLKVYNTVSSLNHHKKTSKKCLDIQKEKKSANLTYYTK